VGNALTRLFFFWIVRLVGWLSIVDVSQFGTKPSSNLCVGGSGKSAARGVRVHSSSIVVSSRKGRTRKVEKSAVGAAGHLVLRRPSLPPLSSSYLHGRSFLPDARLFLL
jgi:hypothetical protein